MTSVNKPELPLYAADREAKFDSGLEPAGAEPHASAENSLLSDIDAILIRLDRGIARERVALDELLARLKSRAV